MRLVVNLVGDAHHGRLAESRFADKPFVPGGELNAMELAFAAAVAGHEVELRGWLHEPTFRRFVETSGTAPAVELDPRPPAADDLVVVPEGWKDPLEYLQIALSPARSAVFVLAAPGLFGWDFSEGWSLPDPLTVDISSLARPEHFAAMRALGFELITHSQGLFDAAGGDCRLLGTGLPWPAPEPAAKEVDAVALGANRWAPLARAVAANLDHVDFIDEAPHEEILARMARARILIWPSRIEGHATIPHEARSVGCVPVALSSNPFAVGLDEDRGARVVDDIAEIAPAVRALLGDPERLAQLAARGRDSAEEEIAWEPFVERVKAWLDAPAPADPGRPARARAGASLRAVATAERTAAQARLEDVNAEMVYLREVNAALAARHEKLLARWPVRTVLAARDAVRRVRRRS